MKIWDEIKNQIKIRDIYPKTLNSRGRGECMLHANSESPSFQLYGDSWYCFSCGKGGDVIHCYQHLHRKDRSTAIKEMAEQYGIESDDYDPVEYREYLKNLHTQKQVFRIFTKLCYDELLSSEHYERIKQERGFTEETINTFKIGLYNQRVRDKLQRDFGDLTLVKYGFKKISDDNRRANWIMGDRIVYPYFDNMDDPVYFIYRKIESEPDFRNAKYLKHTVKNTIKNELFGYFKQGQRDKPLIITEGITDAISVIQANYPCLSPVTVRFKVDDIERMIPYAKNWDKIIVINDNEESGRGLKGAEDTVKELLKSDLNVHIAEIPCPDDIDKIDLDDYLKQGITIERQEELLDELCENSEYGLDHFINKLEDVPNNEIKTEIEKILKLIQNMENVSVSMALSDIKSVTGINIGELRDWMKEIRKDKFNAAKISAEITMEHGILIAEELRKEIIIYKDGYYQIKPINYIDKWINKYFVLNGLDKLSDGKQRSKRANIKNYTLNNKIVSLKQFNKGRTINLKNGIIDLDDLKNVNDIGELELKEHTKNDYSLIRIAVKYDPNAEPGELKNLLINTVGQDNYNMLCEAIGETLLGQPNLFQKCMLFVGMERTGKSTVMNAVMRLIGNDNVSIVSLQELEDDDFAVADLLGKIMNVYPDLPKKHLKSVEKFKQAVGDEKLKGNQKYGNRFNFNNTAKWWLSGNTLPEPGELTGAFFRRFTIIECNNRIPKDQKEVDILNRIATPENLSGLLNEALRGLKRLLERGRYETQITDNTEDLYKKHSNTVDHFIGKYCKYEVNSYEENEKGEYEIEKDKLLEVLNEFEKKIGASQTKSKRILTTKLKKSDHFVRYDRTFQKNNKRYSVYGNIKFNERAYEEFESLNPAVDKHPDDINDEDIDINSPARKKDKQKKKRVVIRKKTADQISGKSINRYTD